MSEEINNQDEEATDDISDLESPDESQQTTEIADEPKPKKRKKKILYIGGSVLLVAVIAGLGYWIYSRQFESTDDAFIDGDIVQISPRVPAYVKKVYVDSNQFVHKGDLLVELASDDFEIKVEQAKAQLVNAQSQRDQALANAGLTRKESGATQTQAVSNVETAADERRTNAAGIKLKIKPGKTSRSGRKNRKGKPRPDACTGWTSGSELSSCGCRTRPPRRSFQ